MRSGIIRKRGLSRIFFGNLTFKSYQYCETFLQGESVKKGAIRWVKILQHAVFNCVCVFYNELAETKDSNQS